MGSKVLPRPLHLLFLTMLLLAAAARARAEVRFEVRSESGIAGEPIVAGLNQVIKPSLYISNPAGAGAPSIQGFQTAIQHDPAYLTFQSVTWKSTALDSALLRASAGPEFFQYKTITTGSQGFTLGVVFEEQTSTFVLGPGDWKAASISYKAQKITPDGSPTRLDFPASLGTPAVKSLYNDQASGETRAPATLGADVKVGAELAYVIGFKDPKLTADSGSEVTASLILQNSPQPVDGFSFGVKYDGASLELLEVTLAEGVTQVLGGPADDRFLAINTAPVGGPGFTVALILSPTDSSKVLDPAKSPHHIVDARFKLKLATGSTSVLISTELGQPKVDVILDLAGTPQRQQLPVNNPPPTTLTIEVNQIAGSIRFTRGDLDQNHRINITDAIGLLSYLFDAGNLLPVFQATRTNCLIAFNVNGNTNGNGEEDLSSIDISDAIFLLNYLFLHGAAPPAPFAGGKACEAFTGTASDAVKCTQYSCQ
jgi:hypothetical protein